MPIKAICPTDPTHCDFITTAHVMEDWKVDKHGNWLDTLKTLQIDHGPDPDNIWTCFVCGAEAEVIIV